MLIDREKVIEEIERRMTLVIKAGTTLIDEAQLGNLSTWISALPSPDEVERWAVVSDGLEFAIFESKENAEGYKLAWGMDGISFQMYPIAIRRLEDKPC